MPSLYMSEPFSHHRSTDNGTLVGLLNAFALSAVFWSMTASAVMLLAD